MVIPLILSCVNDYVEHMATFTTRAKISFSENFCNTKVAGPGETFVQRKYSAVQYTPFHKRAICRLVLARRGGSRSQTGVKRMD